MRHILKLFIHPRFRWPDEVDEYPAHGGWGVGRLGRLFCLIMDPTQ